MYLDKKKQETKYIWEQIDFGQYYALIISNNKYRLLPNLANAVNDGAAIGSILEKQYQFQINHIKNANEDKIYEAFEKLKTLSKNTNILIFYSGHGKLDKKTNPGYWLPIDAHETTKKQEFTDFSKSNLIDITAIKTLKELEFEAIKIALERNNWNMTTTS